MIDLQAPNPYSRNKIYQVTHKETGNTPPVFFTYAGEQLTPRDGKLVVEKYIFSAVYPKNMEGRCFSFNVGTVVITEVQNVRTKQ